VVISRKSGLYSQHLTLNSSNSAVLWLMKCTGHIPLSWLAGDHWWPNFYTDTSSSISNWRGTDSFETPEVYSLCLFPWLICYGKVKVMASQCPSNKLAHYYSLSLSLSLSLSVCPQALLTHSHLNFSALEQKGQGIENEMTGCIDLTL